MQHAVEAQRKCSRGDPGVNSCGPGAWDCSASGFPLCWRHGASLRGGRRETFGRAKACIVLFMWGGPAQQETWDLKPDAPEAVPRRVPADRHERAGDLHLRALPRAGPPGAPAGDHPLGPPRRRQPPDGHARAADRPADPGRRRRRPTGRRLAPLRRGPGAPEPRDASGPPCRRSSRCARPVPDGAPRFVESSHGQGAGWLGPALNPFTIDDDPNRPDYHVGAFRLPDDVGSGRLDDRKRLLQAVEMQARHLERRPQVQALDAHYTRAYDLLTREAGARGVRPDARRPAGSATATACTRTARRSCRRAGWSRRACRW